MIIPYNSIRKETIDKIEKIQSNCLPKNVDVIPLATLKTNSAIATTRTLDFLGLSGSSRCQITKKMTATINSMGKMNPEDTTINTLLRTTSGDNVRGNMRITAIITTNEMMVSFSRMKEPLVKSSSDAP